MKLFINGKEYDVDDCDCDCSDLADTAPVSDHLGDCALRLNVEAIEDGLLGGPIERTAQDYVWGE